MREKPDFAIVRPGSFGHPYGRWLLAEPATMFARAVRAVSDQLGGGQVVAEAQAEPA